MTLSNWLTVIGLITDIIGVIMLFIYGLPSKVKEKGSAFGGTETNEAERQRLAYNKSIELKARLGLGLLIAGFIFQIVANVTPLFTK